MERPGNKVTDILHLLVDSEANYSSNPILEWECPEYSSVEIQILFSEIYLKYYIHGKKKQDN